MSSDRIYSLPLEKVGDFVFDENVVRVFPDMIARSVPGYGSILAMTAELAEHFAQQGTNIYDLGCSLGAITLPMRRRVPQDCTIHAIDSSEAMVARLLELVESANAEGCPVVVTHDDVRSVDMTNASFVVMNFVLQFISLEARGDLLGNLWDGLLPGGAFVLSEKICFDDVNEQHMMSTLHHAFKRANGYSDLEIAQKRTALENALIPETLECHVARLRGVGFSSVVPWFQCLNFSSILAIK